MKKTIFITGHMRGPGHNLDAFDAAKGKLTAEGWEVESPADICREFKPAADGTVSKRANETAMRTCILRLLGCDAIYILPGWEANPGTIAEVTLARALKLEMIWATA